MISRKAHKNCAEFYRRWKKLQRDWSTLPEAERVNELEALKALDAEFYQMPIDECLEAIQFYNPVTIKTPVLDLPAF